MAIKWDNREPNKDYSNSLWSDSGEHSLTPPPTKLDAKSIPELFFSFVEQTPNRRFALYRDAADGMWLTKSWAEAAEDVLRLAAYLQDRCAVRRGDRVIVLSNTRYEWMVADLAILCLGAISTPVYQSSLKDDVGYVLWDTAARIVIAENQEQLNKLEALAELGVQIPAVENFEGGNAPCDIQKVILLEEAQGILLQDRLVSFPSIVTATLSQEKRHEIMELARSVDRSELASIVYTSGTTGPAKGVVQTHDNHLGMLDGVLLSGLLGDGDGIFLFLPLAHSFARLVAYAALAIGGSITFPTVTDRKNSRFDAKQIFRDIQESEPVLFPSVPRMFEKVMSNLTNNEAQDFKSRFAVRSIAHYRHIKKLRTDGTASLLQRMQLPLWKFLVRRVTKRIFGARLRYCISGGAPISIEVLEFFDSIDILILQGYGLTETTPALCASTSRFNRFGTVGRAFDGVELALAEADGEILARGRNIAQGYWRRPGETKKHWLRDGWFCTGDIGTIDADGYLKITDRKKDLIVTAGGKNIAPATLEGQLKASPYISHALVYGDRKPYLVALITLEVENLRQWLLHQNIPMPEVSEFHSLPQVKSLLEAELHSINKRLATYEQIKRFAILPEDFSIENGLLSPSLKLKRKLVIDRYSVTIESLYQHTHE